MNRTRRPIWWLVAGLVLAGLAVLGLALGDEWLVVVPVFIFIGAFAVVLGLFVTKIPDKRYSGYDYSLPAHWGRLLSKPDSPTPPDKDRAPNGTQE